MASGVFNVAGRTCLGVLGVTALYHSAAFVGSISCAVVKGVLQLAHMAQFYEMKELTPPKNQPSLFERVFQVTTTNTPWVDLGLQTLGNVIVATASMYALNKFFPSTVTDANELLHRVVPIQFTPHHIPLLKLAGY